MGSMALRIAMLFAIFTTLLLLQPVNVPMAYGGDDCCCCDCCDPCCCCDVASDDDDDWDQEHKKFCKRCKPRVLFLVGDEEAELLPGPMDGEAELLEALRALVFSPARSTFAIYTDSMTDPTEIVVLPASEGVSKTMKHCTDTADPLWTGCIPPNPKIKVGDAVTYREKDCSPSTGGNRYKDTSYTGNDSEEFRDSEKTGGSGPAD